MVNTGGKFGPYNGPGPVRPGAELVRSRIALRVRLRSEAPGDRLPDAGVLAEELGIGEITVRRALEGMCQDGLLDRRRGRSGGTFVAREWDAVLAVLHDPAEAAALDAFHLLLECGLVSHAAGEIPDGGLDGLRTLVEDMDRADAPDRLPELEARFHLELARTLGGPGIREFAADLLGRQCLLLPAPEPEVVRARNRHHADLLKELVRGDMALAVAAVKAHRHAGPGVV
ncbi:FadR/GntR family transcriptional regulator [Streptomyces arenae]|uniref:FadR/GntR family transcriptional regulator n=1 Tax=Streptomyces arenae TaxID=29301 RepID=UPI00265ADBBE|nr:FCD domain-containing protein [Streptomyces arenae]MCG7206520.1 FCD domain-containing protein [Streptomyces arenae]